MVEKGTPGMSFGAKEKKVRVAVCNMIKIFVNLTSSS